MAKNCIKCGAELEDYAYFCNECGVPQQIENNFENRINNEVKQGFYFEKRNSGLGIASLVLGIISVVSFGVLFIPEILSLVFGIITIDNKNYKHTIAIIGVVLSIIAFIILAVLMYTVD